MTGSAPLCVPAFTAVTSSSSSSTSSPPSEIYFSPPRHSTSCFLSRIGCSTVANWRELETENWRDSGLSKSTPYKPPTRPSNRIVISRGKTLLILASVGFGFGGETCGSLCRERLWAPSTESPRSAAREIELNPHSTSDDQTLVDVSFQDSAKQRNDVSKKKKN